MVEIPPRDYQAEESPFAALDFLESAKRAHDEHGFDFAYEMDRCFATGWMFKAPDYFVMAYEDVANDAWVVWWAEFRGYSGTEALAAALRLMPWFHERIMWARTLKGRPTPRFYSTRRLLRITGLRK